MIHSSHDRRILRDLARRVADIAAQPVMAERKQLWTAHNSLRSTTPLILVFPEGSWGELITADELQCEDDDARRVEHQLRQRVYTHEHFHDHSVIDDVWVVNAAVHSTGWGLWEHHHDSPAARGAWGFDPVLKNRADLAKLHIPELTYDEAATRQALAEWHDLWGDILTVEFKGVTRLTYHLMRQYIGLRGLTEMMMDMYDNPAFLHDVMQLFVAGHKSMLQQYIDFNLLALNNDNSYQNSGGNGWTDELPAGGFNPERVRTVDMWADAEAQELAQVSPEQHYEFSLRYEQELLEPFGLTGYGCCEDLTHKLDYVCQLPRIRRISISPFADVDACAVKLKGNYIFSWKPQPSHLVGEFNAEFIRAYIRHTLDVCRANGCVVEMVLKDTHTCEHHPERFDEWTRIARELCEEFSS